MSRLIKANNKIATITDNQKALLQQLALLYNDIAEEAGKDDSFNQELANLDIFKMSIDDAAYTINNAIN